MKVFSYVIEHDLGFAPNPFQGVCTLACCKPKIRKTAEIGDYVLGTGAARPQLTGRLTYWMRVDEISTFDTYWTDRRFRRKKPIMTATTYLRYGDNIYHHDENTSYIQEDSFHSREDGNISAGDLHRDTGTTDKVLIGHHFAFFGQRGIDIPAELRFVVKKGPGHQCRFTDEQVVAILAWLHTVPQRGYVGEPAHWQFLNRQTPQKSRKMAA